MRTIYAQVLSGSSILAVTALPVPAFGQIADSWTITGDTVLEATNTDTSVTLAPADGVLMTSPSIADGSRNTISASAIGASASVTHASATYQDLTMEDTVGGAITASASNLDSSVTVIGTVDGAVIGQGHDNTISLSAVGASAQLGITDDVLGGATVSRTLTFGGDITLYAENTGAVTLQTDIGANGDGPQITGGTRNAFSGSAVGASAGISVLAVIDDGSYTSNISIAEGSQISITAINSGDVRIGSTYDPSQPAVLSGAAISADSTDGTISLMAIGASGSLTSTTVVYGGSADPVVTFGDASFDVQNTGNVEANVTVSDVSLDGKNSISVGAIGSTISNSSRVLNYAGDSPGLSGTVGSVNFASANTGSILVSGGIGGGVIPAGFGLSIGVNAVGAAASFTLP